MKHSYERAINMACSASYFPVAKLILPHALYSHYIFGKYCNSTTMLDLSQKAMYVLDLKVKYEYLSDFSVLFSPLFIAELILCNTFSLAWHFSHAEGQPDWCHMAINNGIAKQCGISTLWHWMARGCFLVPRAHTHLHTEECSLNVDC